MTTPQFTIDRQEQWLIAQLDGYTPYQWASLSDPERQTRIERVFDRLGSEVIRKALIRLKSLQGRDDMFWWITLAGFQPQLFQQFVKNPPGPVPRDKISQLAFQTFVIEEIRQASEKKIAALQKEAMDFQVSLNDA